MFVLTAVCAKSVFFAIIFCLSVSDKKNGGMGGPATVG